MSLKEIVKPSIFSYTCTKRLLSFFSSMIICRVAFLYAREHFPSLKSDTIDIKTAFKLGMDEYKYRNYTSNHRLTCVAVLLDVLGYAQPHCFVVMFGWFWVWQLLEEVIERYLHKDRYLIQRMRRNRDELRELGDSTVERAKLMMYTPPASETCSTRSQDI